MIRIESIADLELIRESVDLECKLAAGRDGRGALPEDFWPTYSAFGNTEGGLVLLGVREKEERFLVEGVVDVSKVRKDLFVALNNRQKVSVNLLTDAHVREVTLEGRTIIVIEIPRATRRQQPVHLTTNPFAGHTFRRLNDGDHSLTDEEVRRMLAEQVQDSRDERIPRGYGMEDLDRESFRAYRQIFSSRDPGHPWIAEEDREFLRLIGGWRKDRETGDSGLTLAGLLMFGQFTAIQEELPNYMLDYQERPEAKTETRWIDRLTLDGKWSGNLFDFYRRVYLKLTADLKVPFQLVKGERKEETPVHEALREALANVLVHADYSDRASVRVVKHPDRFVFRNPGLMRVPVEVALQGGEPDCRNRTLHKMFRLVGVGEQAGTGIPKILKGWRTQHWSPPHLHDTPVPYLQTLLELRMIDLFPEKVMTGLKRRFGTEFDQLNHVERVALALAGSEGTVNHARLRSVTTEHPVDLSKTLRHLTQAGMLESTGGRGAVYHLPGEVIPTPDDVLGPAPRIPTASSPNLEPSSPNLGPSSPNLGPSSPNLGPSSPNLGPSSPNLGPSSPNLEPSSPNLGPSSPNLGPSSPNLEPSSPNLEPSSPNLGPSSPNLEPSFPYLEPSSPNLKVGSLLTESRNPDGCLLSEQLNLPVIDDLSVLSADLRGSLEALATIPRSKAKVDRAVMMEVILKLCEGRFVVLRCLAELVRRKPETLRDQYLTMLLRDRRLTLAFPKTPTHERQAYSSTHTATP